MCVFADHDIGVDVEHRFVEETVDSQVQGAVTSSQCPAGIGKSAIAKHFRSAAGGKLQMGHGCAVVMEVDVFRDADPGAAIDRQRPVAVRESCLVAEDPVAADHGNPTRCGTEGQDADLQHIHAGRQAQPGAGYLAAGDFQDTVAVDGGCGRRVDDDVAARQAIDGKGRTRSTDPHGAFEPQILVYGRAVGRERALMFDRTGAAQRAATDIEIRAVAVDQASVNRQHFAGEQRDVTGPAFGRYVVEDGIDGNAVQIHQPLVDQGTVAADGGAGFQHDRAVDGTGDAVGSADIQDTAAAQDQRSIVVFIGRAAGDRQGTVGQGQDRAHAQGQGAGHAVDMRADEGHAR